MIAMLHCAHPAFGGYSPADDLPGPPPHLESVPAGSLVIPMDNTLQNLVAPRSPLSALTPQGEAPIMSDKWLNIQHDEVRQRNRGKRLHIRRPLALVSDEPVDSPFDFALVAGGLPHGW